MKLQCGLAKVLNLSLPWEIGRSVEKLLKFGVWKPDYNTPILDCRILGVPYKAVVRLFEITLATFLW